MRIGADVAVAGHAAFEQAVVFQGDVGGDFQFHFEHEFGAFVGGFHRFGRELRIGGDEADFGGEHGIQPVQHNPRFVAHFQHGSLRVGQEDVHAGIGWVNQADDFAARGNHATRFGNAVFHTAVFRAGDFHVALGGFGGFHLRLTCRHACLRFRHAGLRLPHHGQCLRFRRLRRFHRCHRAVPLRTPPLRFGGRHQIFALQPACVVQFHLRHFLLLLLRGNLRIGTRHGFLRLTHGSLRAQHGFTRRRFPRHRLFHLARSNVGRQFGQHVARLHFAALVHQHVLHAAGIQAGHIVALQLQASVGYGDIVGQRVAVLVAEIGGGAGGQCGNHGGGKQEFFHDSSFNIHHYIGCRLLFIAPCLSIRHNLQHPFAPTG